MSAADGRVARLGITEQVVDVLREDILAGILPPGSSLREAALTERLGVSRSSVREAIRALVAEGLVRSVLHRGAVVAEPSADDLRDVFTARAAVEDAVAAALARRAPEAGALAAARAALEDLEAAVAANDLAASAEADQSFHRALVEAAGVPRLAAFYRQLQGELRLLQHLADREAPEPDKVGAHAALLCAVVERDGDTFARAAAEHRARAETSLLRHVP